MQNVECRMHTRMTEHTKHEVEMHNAKCKMHNEGQNLRV
jgi:hypothetical protein